MNTKRLLYLFYMCYRITSFQLKLKKKFLYSQNEPFCYPIQTHPITLLIIIIITLMTIIQK